MSNTLFYYILLAFVNWKALGKVFCTDETNFEISNKYCFLGIGKCLNIFLNNVLINMQYVT